MITPIGWDNKQGCPVKERDLKGMKLVKVWRSFCVRLFSEFGQNENVCWSLEVINVFRKLFWEQEHEYGRKWKNNLGWQRKSMGEFIRWGYTSEKLKYNFLQIQKLLDRIFDRASDSDCIEDEMRSFSGNTIFMKERLKSGKKCDLKTWMEISCMHIWKTGVLEELSEEKLEFM